jgi:hypothetical protein
MSALPTFSVLEPRQRPPEIRRSLPDGFDLPVKDTRGKRLARANNTHLGLAASLFQVFD